MGRRLLLFVDGLLLIGAVFLGVRLYETWSARPPVAVPESTTPAAGSAPPASQTAATPPPLTAYAAVAERNLFSATRTEAPPEPPRPPPGTGAPAAPPAPRPRLHGVVILPEGRGRAYLEDVQRRRVHPYSVGDHVGDARLEQIKSDRVVLRRGGETFEVLLYDPSKPRQVSAPSGVQ
ncbi:MAG: type II secretion system protein N, partial [Candidatus Rokuibacteriota bacterium]